MKTLDRVYANAGVEKEYQKKLDKLVDAMSKSVMYWVLADYSGRTTRQMALAIRKRIKQWDKIFGKDAEKISEWFVRSMKKHTETGMRTSFANAGLKLKKGVPQNIQLGVELENKSLIKSIPEKYFSGVEVVALMALLYNWNKSDLTKELEKRYNITKRRVKTIASDQTHKTNELMKRSICTANGVKYGVWQYTYLSKKPRENHIEMDGTIFDIEKGCPEVGTGEYIFPSERINCSCNFVPVIEEIGDDLRKEVEKRSYYKKIARGL